MYQCTNVPILTNVPMYYCSNKLLLCYWHKVILTTIESGGRSTNDNSSSNITDILTCTALEVD